MEGRSCLGTRRGRRVRADATASSGASEQELASRGWADDRLRTIGADDFDRAPAPAAASRCTADFG